MLWRVCAVLVASMLMEHLPLKYRVEIVEYIISGD